MPRMASDPKPGRVTQILHEWSAGSREALGELMPHVVDELRRMAARALRGEAGSHTLQPTALVNELYLRLAGRRSVDWKNRAHFLGFAAQAMRRVLVDHVRAKYSAKRGDGAVRVTLLPGHAASAPPDVDLIALDRALDRLTALDRRQAQIVELRFFGGLSVRETAEVLGVGEATVVRDWASARAWLFRELSPPGRR
jgi:RNA polymerase sigma factor (TIGR02999 family)